MKAFSIQDYYSIGGKEKYENNYTTSLIYLTLSVIPIYKKRGFPLSSYNSKFLV